MQLSDISVKRPVFAAVVAMLVAVVGIVGFFSLSVREIEVLEQLSKGLKYSAIAENLFISAGTIRKHIENIYAKLQVHNKIEAIQKARSNNLI